MPARRYPAAAVPPSALGMPWETVREDYLHANEYRREEIERLRAELLEPAAD